MDKNYYEILGVTRSASVAEIKKNYTKLKGKYDPKLSGKKSTKKWDRIKLAYCTLSDKNSRYQYDLELDNISFSENNQEQNIVLPIEAISKKAYFLPRLLAFFLDVVLVSTVASLLFSIFPQTSNLVKLNNQQVEMQKNYLEQKITNEEYLAQSFALSYDIAYANVIYVIINTSLAIGYFVVFQYKKNGQTIGKSLMKIRIVSNNPNANLTMNNYLMRSLVIQSIFLDVLLVASVLVMPKNIYGMFSVGLSFIQMIVMLATVIMILYRHDGRGVHDMLANTRVIMDIEKEKVLCQS